MQRFLRPPDGSASQDRALLDQQDAQDLYGLARQLSAAGPGFLPQTPAGVPFLRISEHHTAWPLHCSVSVHRPAPQQSAAGRQWHESVVVAKSTMRISWL